MRFIAVKLCEHIRTSHVEVHMDNNLEHATVHHLE